MNNLIMYFKSTKPTSAILGATRSIARGFPSMHKIAIEVSGSSMNQNGFTWHDIENRIKGESPILKPKGMLDKETPKAATLLRNGRNYRDNINIGVPFVASIKNLLKTISFHCQKVAQIISQTFNHYAVTAIAKSGSERQGYFNIYENPELPEGK